MMGMIRSEKVNNIHEIDTISYFTELMSLAVKPAKIYLFGSFTTGQDNEDSDYDFYIVLHDSDTKSRQEANKMAYQSLRHKMNRDVDIIVDYETSFKEQAKRKISLEKIILEEGVILYESNK